MCIYILISLLIAGLKSDYLLYFNRGYSTVIYLTLIDTKLHTYFKTFNSYRIRFNYISIIPQVLEGARKKFQIASIRNDKFTLQTKQTKQNKQTIPNKQNKQKNFSSGNAGPLKTKI